MGYVPPGTEYPKHYWLVVSIVFGVLLIGGPTAIMWAALSH